MNATLPQDESTLVNHARAGDVDAFFALVEPHKGALRAMAYGMIHDAHLVDDVMQDAYLKAFRSITRFNGKSAFRSWMFRIVANASIDLLRKRSHETTSWDATKDAPIAGDVESDLVGNAVLVDALSTLTVLQRAVVLMVDAHGFGYAEAGRTLGLSVGGISYQLMRGRKALLEALKQREFLEEHDKGGSHS